MFSSGEEGEEVKSTKRKAIGVESEEEAEEISLVPSAIIVPPKASVSV